MTSPQLTGTTQTGDLSPTPDELITAYERGIDDLSASVAGMSNEQLLARPIAGKWSTLEVICHIADCEQFFADRIKRTIALERPLLMAVDSDLYLDSLNYQQHDVQKELDLVAATRRQLVRILRTLHPTSWHRTAVHSEKGLMTLHQLLHYPTNHLNHHLKFIAEKRAAMK